MGDLAGDNAVGITDIVITAKILCNQIPYIKSLFAAADLNADNVINAVDLAIMKYLVLKK
ncbi:MAG: dockerin type I domain-containing protein [Oscillospiraceae bacterium]|nr:dockerin type I domain-containing protein [Oscillospiraceae bacterium]